MLSTAAASFTGLNIRKYRSRFCKTYSPCYYLNGFLHKHSGHALRSTLVNDMIKLYWKHLQKKKCQEYIHTFGKLKS